MFQEDFHKKEYSCFDFPAHLIFTFDVFWVSLGTIFLETQVRSQIILDPDYLPDYLSVSYDYNNANIPVISGVMRNDGIE